MDPFQLGLLNGFTSTFTSLVALIVSIIALVYTVKAFLLKSGAHIRGSYVMCSSISCDDKYVHTVNLENLKDRAVVIFKIYLQVGHNYYIEIDDFENDPLILRPFEIFTREYDPIDLYSYGTGRVLLNDLLEDKTAKQRIVLSTSEGKFIVKDFINYWDPIDVYFQNYATAIIRPIRSIYKGKSYGSNAKFLVEFKMENGQKEIVPIYPKDYEFMKFRHFSLTKESLSSKEALEEYLYKKVIEGTLKCTDVIVNDLGNWRDEINKTENDTVITAKYENWFEYFVIARIESKISDCRLEKQNRSLKPKRALIKGAVKGRNFASFQEGSAIEQNSTPKVNPNPPQQQK